jgi:hypothetical protein
MDLKKMGCENLNSNLVEEGVQGSCSIRQNVS